MPKETYTYELNQDYVRYLLGMLDKVTIQGGQAESHVMVKRKLMEPLSEGVLEDNDADE